jgi:hypothetical protein
MQLSSTSSIGILDNNTLMVILGHTFERCNVLLEVGRISPPC